MGHDFAVELARLSLLHRKTISGLGPLLAGVLVAGPFERMSRVRSL